MMNILMNFDFSLTYYLLTFASFRIGVPSILFRVASTQIFFRVVARKKSGVVLINQKKNQVSTLKKNLGRCYPKKISGGTL